MRSWESLGIWMRWALLGASAIMLAEKFQTTAGIAAFGLLAASNVFGMSVLRARQDSSRGMPIGTLLRFGDGVFLTALSFVPELRNENLWLLGVPGLVFEALATRRMANVAGLAGVMMLVQGSADIALHRGASALGLSIGIIASGAVTAALLAYFKAREDLLIARDRRLATVLDCGGAFAASRDLTATMLHTLKAAVTETGGTCGYVMLLEDESEGPLTTEVAYSEAGEFEFPKTLDIGFGLSGYVAKMGQPITVSDQAAEHRGFDGVTAGVHSAISVPLLTRTGAAAGKAGEDQILGVFTILNTRPRTGFDSDDVDLCRTLASLIAVAVANARMEERQHFTFVRTLESLATALEARDEYTQGHSQRVCEVSLMLGEKLGFGLDALEELRVGTVLHDIGKIGVPDAILNKRGKLTDEEFEVMKSHPVIGYEICRPLLLSEGVLMIIRNHHEKLDGTGYPDGLKGGELPLSLRIVCVADAFDAMSSSRPYRDVMSQDAVLSELSRGAGVQFDPVVVECLKGLLQTDRMRELYRGHWTESVQQVA